MRRTLPKAPSLNTHRDQRNAVAHGGGQLVRGEQKAAVAGRSTAPARRGARAARRARWQSPSRDCPDSRARGTCAACRPARRGARRSRSASPRRQRCRPRAVRRGSPRGRRAAARAWRAACAMLGLALLHLRVARGPRAIVRRQRVEQALQDRLRVADQRDGGLGKRAGSSGSASTRTIARSLSMPQC